jgi:HK97 family phage major capsid protein
VDTNFYSAHGKPIEKNFIPECCIYRLITHSKLTLQLDLIRVLCYNIVDYFYYFFVQRTLKLMMEDLKLNYSNLSEKYDTTSYRRAFMDYVLRRKPLPVEYRADATTYTSDVGAAIPNVVINEIIQKLETYGMILPLVRRTVYKGGAIIPTSSIKPSAQWVNEGAGSDTLKQPINGAVTFTYHKLRCAIAVSLEANTMAVSAFESLLINNIVEAMVVALEQAIISGNGVSSPKGILTKTPPTGQLLTVDALNFSALTNAEAALPQAYENDAVWCMSKKTFMNIYGMTDSTGQPIGRVDYGIDGKPIKSLLGRPVVACDYVQSYTPGMADGINFAFLFNFKDYILNTNYNMTIGQYTEHRTEDLIRKAVMLVDGKVVDVNSLVVLQSE